MEQQMELESHRSNPGNLRPISGDKYANHSVKTYQNNRQRYLDKLKDALAQNNEGLINSILSDMKVFGRFFINIRIYLEIKEPIDIQY